METWTLQKEFRFEASHQLPNHDGKCARLHGHSWVGRIEVSGNRLHTDGPKAGMLLDFGDISAALKPLLDAFLDHHHLNETTGLHNPTSEAIARWIYERLEAVLQIAQEVGQWSDGRHTVEHEGTVQVNIADTTALEVAQLFLPHEIEAALRKLPEPATENS